MWGNSLFNVQEYYSRCSGWKSAVGSIHVVGYRQTLISSNIHYRRCEVMITICRKKKSGFNMCICHNFFSHSMPLKKIFQGFSNYTENVGDLKRSHGGQTYG